MKNNKRSLVECARIDRIKYQIPKGWKSWMQTLDPEVIEILIETLPGLFRAGSCFEKTNKGELLYEQKRTCGIAKSCL